MATEGERIVRWKVLGLIAIGGIAAGLVAYGHLTGAEWVQAVGTTLKGLAF